VLCVRENERRERFEVPCGDHEQQGRLKAPVLDREYQSTVEVCGVTDMMISLKRK